MRAQYALGAVAVVGALVYGAADPVNAALTASAQSRGSAQASAQARAGSGGGTAVSPQARAGSSIGTSPLRSSVLHSAALTIRHHPAPAAGAPAGAPAAAGPATVEPDPGSLLAAITGSGSASVTGASAPATTAGAGAGSSVAPASTTAPAASPSAAPATPGPTPSSSLEDIRRSRDKHRAALRKGRSSTPAATPKRKRTKSGSGSGGGVPKAPAARHLTPRPGHVVSTEQSYGPAAVQRVTVSRLAGAGRQPAVYFIHGGSWIAGGRGEWTAEAERWAQYGWTAINIGYRLDVNGRLMLGDIRTVVSDFERRPQVDPHRQILVGSSAGAHLAESIAVRFPGEFRGVVAWSPVVSPQEASANGASVSRGVKFRLASAARRLWGPNWRVATPVSYVSAQTPPLWAAASRNEWLRWSDQGDLLCTALGTRCSANLVPGRTHGAHLADTHPLLRQRALAWAIAQVSVA